MQAVFAITAQATLGLEVVERATGVADRQSAQLGLHHYGVGDSGAFGPNPTIQPPVGWSRLMPIFPRVAALLGNEFCGMAAVQAGTFGGVPHIEPGELDGVAGRQLQVLAGVQYGYSHAPRRYSVGHPFMIGDVSLSQARTLFAVPRIDTLVRGQVSVVQRRMFVDMAVFGSCVLRDVPRTGLSVLHPLVHHDGHLLRSRPYLDC